MKSFLFGLGLGLGLGILFAPMSGEDTRQNISDRTNDLANSARDTYETGRERVQRGIEAIRGRAGEMRASVSESTGTHP
jgi:gas vesicle protein